uniref:Uncharacterized protein n=1 Tax=Anguilla anguilla TaxID=7936 RepID=A0A0E9QYA8_ANGAN
MALSGTHTLCNCQKRQAELAD